MSELLQMLTLIPHPITSAREVSFIVPEDSDTNGFCPRCNRDLPAAKFARVGNAKLASQCRECAMKQSEQRAKRKVA